MKFLEVAQVLFKFFCVIAVLSMIVLWVIRFMEDEDLCLVEYKSFRAANDVELPDVSLCVMNPFDEHKLNVLGTNTKAYRGHLAGNAFNESLIDINFIDVIFDVGRYYNGTDLMYRDGTYGNLIGGSVTTRLTVFYYQVFFVCYGIDMKHSKRYDVNYANHNFLRHPHLQDLFSSKEVFLAIHGPNQILLSNQFRSVSFDINATYGGDIGVAIDKAEVVKRRNKPKDPCVVQWRNWNEMAISKHIVDIGCVPTYLETHENVSICSTMGTLKKWSKILYTIRNQHDYQPCQQMPRIDFDLETDLIGKTEEFMVFGIGYPEQVKIITQSRAVNVDALIGNIGGYIGNLGGTSDAVAGSCV